VGSSFRTRIHIENVSSPPCIAGCKYRPFPGDSPDALPAKHANSTTVGSNGVIVLGPWDHRKAYVPLDAIIVPKHFLGAWADAEEGCDATPVPTAADETTEGTKIVISESHITGQKGRAVYLGSYVEAERHVPFKRATGDKPIALSAHKFRNSNSITLWLQRPGQEGTSYVFLQTTPELMTIKYSENGYG
jgi:hypothetical protein